MPIQDALYMASYYMANYYIIMDLDVDWPFAM